MIKAAIFDFNGVVIANNDLATFRAAARARGVWFPVFLLRYCLYNCAHLTGKLDSFAFWSRVLDNGQALSSQEFQALLAAPYKANKLVYAVLDLVAWLRRQGVKCVLLTNTSDYQVAANKALNRYKGFDAVILSNEAKAMKPWPKAFRLAAQAAGARADECIFVDDSWYNIWAARLLGFKAIACRSPAQLTADLKKLFDHRLD